MICTQPWYCGPSCSCFNRASRQVVSVDPKQLVIKRILLTGPGRPRARAQIKSALSLYKHIYIHMICVYIYRYIYIHICVFTYIYIYAHIYLVCVHTCMSSGFGSWGGCTVATRILTLIQVNICVSHGGMYATKT